MTWNPSPALAIGIPVVVGALAFPVFGWLGSIPAAFTAFYVVVLIGSGFRAVRAIAWGLVTGGLFAVATLVPRPADLALVAVGTAMFYAAVLLPSFRRRWFGQAIE